MIKLSPQNNLSRVNYPTEESDYVIENQSAKEPLAKKTISNFPQITNSLVSKLFSVTIENKNFAKLFLTATVFANQFLNAAAKNAPNFDNKLYNTGLNLMLSAPFVMLSAVVFAAIYFCCVAKKDHDNLDIIDKNKEKWGVRMIIAILSISMSLILIGYGLMVAGAPNT